MRANLIIVVKTLKILTNELKVKSKVNVIITKKFNSNSSFLLNFLLIFDIFKKYLEIVSIKQKKANLHVFTICIVLVYNDSLTIYYSTSTHWI